MELTEPGVAPSRGLLNKHESLRRFDLIRIAPAEAVADYIENHWLVRWDLSGMDDYVQENLPHPSVNMAIVPGAESGVWGVQTGKWVYRLSGRGALFGTKFRPGAFSAIFEQPVSELTDRHVAIASVFGTTDAALEDRLEKLSDESRFGATIDALVEKAARPLSSGAILARQIVEMIDADPELKGVAGVARRTGLGVRTLQRLFKTHVGVGPKWVIDRYRLIEAVEALNRGEATSLTALAHDLGYFDQAHFSRRFQTLTGMTPSQYRTSRGE